MEVEIRQHELVEVVDATMTPFLGPSRKVISRWLEPSMAPTSSESRKETTFENR